MTIDSVGWIPDDGIGALSSLRTKALETATNAGKQAYEQRGARMCCGQGTIFPDLEACVVHRAKQTLAGAIAVDEARMLVKRGTMPSRCQTGIVWTADAAVMQTRVRPSEPFVEAVLEGIQCPQAFVLARDGLFKTCSLPHLPLFSVMWGLVVCLGYWAMAGFHSVKMLLRASHRPLQPQFPSPLASLASRLAFLYLLLRRRIDCGRKNAAFLFAEQGGHHVHLTNAETVIKILKTWLQTTGADDG